MRRNVLGLLTLVLLLLLVVNEPIGINGICEFKKNGTLARCQYFEDINFITNSHDLKSLKLSVVEKHLSIDVFKNLTNLRHLDLSNGKLRKILPGTFLNLRALRSIDLSNNHLVHLEHGTFDGPLHLRHLNLRGNSLDRIPPDTRNIKELIFLDLAENKIYCDCLTLKERDSLREHGINTTSDTLCAGPRNFQGIALNEPDAEVICMFEKQDQEEGMQGDEPEGSGDLGSGDPFDDIVDADVPEEEEKIPPNNSSIAKEITTTEKSQETTLIVEIPLTPAASKDDGMYFSEDKDKTNSSLTTTANNNTNETDDLYEGSGIEGSGVGVVPPIDWANVPETTSSDNPDTQQPKTTESSIWSWSLFDIFATTPSKLNSSTETFSTTTTTTMTTVNSDDQVNLEQDEFLPVSTTEPPPPPPSPTPSNENAKMRVVADEERKAEVEDSNELPDASSAIQSKKGVGSYLVLAILLVVLVCLIGFAAYRGDFCNAERKRNTRNPDLTDVENGTELKDLTKSLLDGNNAASSQPKISSSNNGNSKLEAVPLVVAATQNKSHTKNHSSNEEPTAKYVGVVGDSNADPVKPPRKSYSPNNDQDVETNGKDVLANGKHDRDSLSSGSLSNQLPSSPGAQRVKITLQDNPDSVPKTPLLITKIKGGENLVKTSP